ncbi:helix-turn-helix transcriptional regulator [Aminobacter sp. AP02]|uniref:AraC family transcriptional regulator n=1 Tax=Aminobacter sp. AP02 TaxID=2135737 RepID=UPI000D7B1D9E|nr:helix-turn-helix transcriptional regulator [Aminobacter sp. AP02]PWK60779.1 AraC-like DNA-binding protein [Aminobacter sp. AP02]
MKQRQIGISLLKSAGGPELAKRPMPKRYDWTKDVRNRLRSELDPDQFECEIRVVSLSAVPDWRSLPFHCHNRAEILYVTGGLLQLETRDSVFVAPAQSALWIPSGVVHRVRSLGSFDGYVLFLDFNRAAEMPQECAALTASSLFLALIERASHFSKENDRESHRQRLLEVLLDEILVLPLSTPALPLPLSPRLREVSIRLIEAPSVQVGVSELSRSIGMSPRNMSRRFRAETGMSLGKWRGQAQILSAVIMLSTGSSVKEVAYSLGYESTSAFIAMFRRNVGYSPGKCAKSAR